jgi:uncharacterized protein YjdB
VSMMRSRCICVSLVIALAILTACGGGGSSSGKQTTAPSLSSIAVTPATVTLIAGQTQQLTATATYSDGSTANVTSSTTWSSSNASVATVALSGLLTATTAGQATITATTAATKGSSSLTVNAKVVTSVSITPQTQTLFLNSTQRFDAVAVYNDGSAQDITTTAQWQSSAPSYATVSDAGVVTTVAAGNVTISAATSDGSVSSSADVTVDPSNTGVTMINDLTDSRLMVYWPGDGSVVTYSGTRNSDGTFAAINGARIAASPAANQPDQMFTFDSQGRESTITLSDGTLIGFNWTANPTMVVIPPNQGSTVVVPLPTTSASQSRKPRAASQAASSAPSVSVNVTTDLGAGAKPEDNAAVYVHIDYTFGGSPTGRVRAMETSPGSGQYTLSLASGPSDVSPAILQSSASKALAAICQIPLPAALLCGPEAPGCAIAIAALKDICTAQSGAQNTLSAVNYLNKLIPPNVWVETDPNGCGYYDFSNTANRSYAWDMEAQCTPTTITVNPNPATTSVGGTLGLGASAYYKTGVNEVLTQIPSSTLAWSWAAGSGVPSLQDSYLQITPQGTDTPEGWLGGKFSVAVANVAGQNPTPAGSPDTVTAVETNSNQSGVSSVTVEGLFGLTWLGTVTWFNGDGQMYAEYSLSQDGSTLWFSDSPTLSGLPPLVPLFTVSSFSGNSTSGSITVSYNPGSLSCDASGTLSISTETLSGTLYDGCTGGNAWAQFDGTVADPPSSQLSGHPFSKTH